MVRSPDHPCIGDRAASDRSLREELSIDETCPHREAERPTGASLARGPPSRSSRPRRCPSEEPSTFEGALERRTGSMTIRSSSRKGASREELLLRSQRQLDPATPHRRPGWTDRPGRPRLRRGPHSVQRRNRAPAKASHREAEIDRPLCTSARRSRDHEADDHDVRLRSQSDAGDRRAGRDRSGGFERGGQRGDATESWSVRRSRKPGAETQRLLRAQSRPKRSAPANARTLACRRARAVRRPPPLVRTSRSVWSKSLSALGALEEVEHSRRETVVLPGSLTPGVPETSLKQSGRGCRIGAVLFAVG